VFFERFSEKARAAVVLAQQVARERGDEKVEPAHLLAALVRAPDSLAVVVLEAFSVRRADLESDLAGGPPRQTGDVDAAALAALGIDLDEVRRRVEDAFGPGALERRRGLRRGRGGHLPFAKESKKVLELALGEAISLGHNYIGTEHLLLGLLRGDSPVGALLAARGVRSDVARVIVEELVRGRRAG
jgi:ATP-dependent Clp protease ATP-binding subunit ClpA